MIYDPVKPEGRPFPDPSILLHPQIPKPLHTMNPRSLLGQEWWDEKRKLAMYKHGLRCWACGIARSEAWCKQWLEGHEMYRINYATGEVVFVEVVSLCHACHNYIHKGRLATLLAKGELKPSYVNYILEYGGKLLTAAGLPLVFPVQSNDAAAPWEAWHLVIEGVNYGQRFHSYREWANHWGYESQEPSIDSFFDNLGDWPEG